MTEHHPDRPSVAVIGAGVSGLTAAYVLSQTHDVTLFEADDRLGGHAHTHTVPTSGGGEVRVDSGFIVHNERTYPHLLRLFRELDVPTRPTEMSMSITCDGCGLSWAGGAGLGAVLAQPRRLADPRFLRMLLEIPRFHKAARAVLADTGGSGSGDDPTWGEFLQRGSFSEHFIAHFALPLVSCVWSSGDEDSLDYPARHLFAFLEHHGMLSISGSPTWRTVVGGSRTYVDALASRLRDVRTSAAVTSVTRRPDGVDVRTAAGVTPFDKVVIATHADQALALLADATPQEKEDLGAIRYSRNATVLHRDTTHLPSATRAKASWNYRSESCGGASRARVSYWMNRLQGFDEDGDQLLVTLNSPTPFDEADVVARMDYAHPVFTREAVAAAARLRTAGGDRLAFAGAHLGWGFHEDGCRSGVEAAQRLGATW
ncbi:NAD(P)/FAD-dependent oxidoreductase [Janibacter limosus]|uniref:FAD-dependent oxidoreductase n=1 Tax=Janibacter limosus TaxID=53458 RepID=A0A4P6MWN9_9MICO|nr:FAD-dependent oxidoreductase [Janibacter limosus]QBF46285.1 FAD-dependent oxidoreductase [Janibacter limosus]